MYRLQMQFYLHGRETPVYVLKEYETEALAEKMRDYLHRKLKLDEWEFKAGPWGIQAIKAVIRQPGG